MTRLLLLVHVVLGLLAIGAGAVMVFDVLVRRFRVSPPIWFLRFSLGSSVAALLLSVFQLVPAQKVEMVAVYGAGLAVMAWRGFHLRGAWREAFAFTLALVLYLNILALSIQAPGFGTNTWVYLQAALFATVVGLGIVAAKRFSDKTTLSPFMVHGGPSHIDVPRP
jgi:hypothetical protein